MYDLANDDSKKRPEFEAQFEWEGQSSGDDWSFAEKCGCLPIVQLTTRGFLEDVEVHRPAAFSTVLHSGDAGVQAALGVGRHA